QTTRPSLDETLTRLQGELQGVTPKAAIASKPGLMSFEEFSKRLEADHPERMGQAREIYDYYREHPEMLDSLAGEGRTHEQPPLQGEVYDAIRKAYDEIRKGQTHEWVSLTQLRKQLSDFGHSEVDLALTRMSRAQEAVLTPDSNQKTLTATDRASALKLGGEDKHLISLSREGRSFEQAGQPKLAPVFFSVAERAVQGVKQEKAPAGQWMGTLKNAGVKAEELEWLDLDNWLKSHNGPVSKAEVLDYINAHKIEVREEEKGERPTGRMADA